jgi:cytochrome c oxidase subunit 2
MDDYPYSMNFNTTRRGLVILVPAIFALTGCATDADSGFSGDASSINEISHSLWTYSWLAAAVVGVFTAILIVWPAIFHRAPKNGPEFPKQTQYNVPVEVAYTIIPFIIVAVLFYFTAVKENEIVKSQASVQHEIEVSGFQWSWQFTYLDEGKNVQVTGTPAKPPVLVVPQGERVRYTIVSNDVVHGFWIPEFMIQMQNLPGVTNYLEFTANKLGDFPGRCNILCGRNHAQMLFTVRVVTPAEYQTYISNLKLETEKAGQA